MTHALRNAQTENRRYTPPQKKTTIVQETALGIEHTTQQNLQTA
jgi:hypothetical protein